jgi:hypothetical protein
VGTEANDTLIGTPLADVIFSIGGADVVASEGGADLIYTGSGDDQISIQDNAFRRIDAGSGFDQLLLEGAANQAYDFRLDITSPQYFIGTKLQDIELISSLGYGANTLSFDAAAVNASNPDRILFLACDASDTVALSNEFARNVSLDTSFAGQRWYAFAASQQGGLSNSSAINSNPALLYLALPADANASWLDTNITLAVNSTAAPALAADSKDVSTSAPVAKRTLFGNGLSVIAEATSTTSSSARFLIQRQDAAAAQVVMYSTSSTNSLADSGVDYTAACGVLLLQPGETSKVITVPLLADSLSSRRNSSLSLEIQELPYSQQQELHLLLQPLADPTTGKRPVLSAMTLAADPAATTARLSLRADSNSASDDALRLSISTRQSADSFSSSRSTEVLLRDFSPKGSVNVARSSEPSLPLDRDGRDNQQVSTAIQLNFKPEADQASVSLIGPDFIPTTSIDKVGTNQIRFSQAGPITTWRSDSGTGKVNFGLQAGGTNQSLLSGALGGSAGSINPTNALDANPSSGWRGSEGMAVGSRSITTIPNLIAQAWTPTASRDGVDLALLEVNVNGNQVTASFQGGVSAEIWQAGGSAPAQQPTAPMLEVQRLAGADNAIGFYSVDTITGAVNGRTPGDAGYLQAALARCEAEDLLLTAAELPAFGQTSSYRSLPLDSQKSYGVLLLQNGDRNSILSSFSAANPGGETQMVRLGSDATRFVLGIEDIAVTSARCDRDFNDNVLTLSGVSLGLF